MGLLMDLTRAIRNLRAEYNVTPGKRIPALIAAGDLAPVLTAQRAELCSLAKLDAEGVVIEAVLEQPDQAATAVVGDLLGYLPLAGMVDLDAERERLRKELDEVDERIVCSEGLLAGEFAEKAPPHIVQRERDKLSSIRVNRKQLIDRLEQLGLS